MDHPTQHRWVLRVPVYTDIEDSAFIDRVWLAIEHAWQVRDGEDGFSLALDIHRVSLVDHTRRFPSGGAVLTTGANTTHVRGRHIILGPRDITPKVLAHEFGHILGFVDGYFRSYRDRGPSGYEVLEVVIDLDDIMSAPGHGRAQREHFEQVPGETRG